MNTLSYWEVVSAIVVGGSIYKVVEVLVQMFEDWRRSRRISHLIDQIEDSWEELTSSYEEATPAKKR